MGVFWDAAGFCDTPILDSVDLSCVYVLCVAHL